KYIPTWVLDLSWYKVIYKFLYIHYGTKISINYDFYNINIIELQEMIINRVYTIIILTIILTSISLIVYKKIYNKKAINEDMFKIVVFSLLHSILFIETILAIPISILICLLIFIFTQDINKAFKTFLSILHITSIMILLWFFLNINNYY
uniref:hypothetical protein n=1 Tax=Campylobacter fetus TaxID=196 RepID=UPI001C131132